MLLNLLLTWMTWLVTRSPAMWESVEKNLTLWTKIKMGLSSKFKIVYVPLKSILDKNIVKIFMYCNLQEMKEMTVPAKMIPMSKHFLQHYYQQNEVILSEYFSSFKLHVMSSECRSYIRRSEFSFYSILCLFSFCSFDWFLFAQLELAAFILELLI